MKNLHKIRAHFVSKDFWTGLLSTVLGIALTFGTTYLIEQYNDYQHKRQYLVCMINYINGHEEALVKDSIEAEKYDSIISPLLTNYSQTGGMPTRDELNELSSMLSTFGQTHRDESNRNYFNGNSETLQLLDIYTINNFNSIVSTLEFLNEARAHRDNAREQLSNWLAAKMFSKKSMDKEGYWKEVNEELMSHPSLSEYYMYHIEYKVLITQMLPIIRGARTAIMNVHQLEEEDFKRYERENPYIIEFEKIFGKDSLDKNINIDLCER